MDNWSDINSRLDALNLGKGNFYSDNRFGIPLLRKENHDIDNLIPFGVNKERDGFAHMFLDDYRIERLWNKPKKYLNMLDSYHGVFTPDFSLYGEYPYAMKLWNVYRNRWLGAYWQSQGIPVIPTVSWGENAFEFCFCGIEQDSIVAVSSVGVANNDYSINNFMSGFNIMCRVLNPSKVLFYGDPIGEWDVDIQYFTSFARKKFKESV